MITFEQFVKQALDAVKNIQADIDDILSVDPIARCEHCASPLERDGCPVCDHATAADVLAVEGASEIPEDAEGQDREYSPEDEPEWAAEDYYDYLLPPQEQDDSAALNLRRA